MNSLALLHFDVKFGNVDFFSGQAIVEHRHVLEKYVCRYHRNRMQCLYELVLYTYGELVVVQFLFNPMGRVFIDEDGPIT